MMDGSRIGLISAKSILCGLVQSYVPYGKQDRVHLQIRRENPNKIQLCQFILKAMCLNYRSTIVILGIHTSNSSFEAFDPLSRSL